MGELIGQLLPFAVGVAISPIPIIAVVLVLLSPRAGGVSAGFLLGWLIGIVVVTVVFLLLAGAVEPSGGGPSTVVSCVKLVLGALLLLLAVRQWRSRPHASETPALPGWMSAVDKLTPVRAAGMGAALSGLNPKNLALGVAAGSSIGAAGLSAARDVVAVAVFTALAASTVAVPVIACAVAADRMRPPLDSLRRWLLQENTVVMAVLLLVMGTVLVGDGIRGVT